MCESVHRRRRIDVDGATSKLCGRTRAALAPPGVWTLVANRHVPRRLATWLYNAALRIAPETNIELKTVGHDVFMYTL
jgi:hypothetical protein